MGLVVVNKSSTNCRKTVSLNDNRVLKYGEDQGDTDLSISFHLAAYHSWTQTIASQQSLAETAPFGYILHIFAARNPEKSKFCEMAAYASVFWSERKYIKHRNSTATPSQTDLKIWERKWKRKLLRNIWSISILIPWTNVLRVLATLSIFAFKKGHHVGEDKQKRMILKQPISMQKNAGSEYWSRKFVKVTMKIVIQMMQMPAVVFYT